MKQLKTLLIILAAVLFFTACEKEESPENFNAISGLLTAGENVTAEDLKSLGIYIAKLDNNIAADAVTTETTEFKLIASSSINEDGSFSFTNLENGNYIVALSEDFMFPTDTFLVVNINGNNIIPINSTVDRVPAENISLKRKITISNYTDFPISKINFYYGNEPYTTIERGDFTEATIKDHEPNLEIKWEFKVKLDKSRKVQFTVTLSNEKGEELTSSKISFFSGSIARETEPFIEVPQGDLFIFKCFVFKHTIDLILDESKTWKLQY